MSTKEAVPPDELAQRSLRRMVAELTDELHWAIDDGLTLDTLHSIVGLWEANNNNEDLTYESLVEGAKPTTCDDCAIDVTPYDEDGRPTEGAWEWYMVRDEIWVAASRDGPTPRILCIGCLEERLGRRLAAADFSEFGINEPGGLESSRLHDRLTVINTEHKADG